jgi:hypothetical protein
MGQVGGNDCGAQAGWRGDQVPIGRTAHGEHVSGGFPCRRDSHVGKLDKALDEAKAKNWTVVSMKNDWKKIFAFE